MNASKEEFFGSIRFYQLCGLCRLQTSAVARFKFPVPDRERMLEINRALSAVYCFSPKLCSFFSRVFIGEI